MTSSTRTLKPAPTDPVQIRLAVEALSSALMQVDTAHRRIRYRLARDLGLSVGELTAIYLVRTTESCTPKHLAAELDLSTGAITSLVDRLERSGHLERRQHPTDRRSQLLAVTSVGREANETMMNLYNSAVEGVVMSSPCVFDQGLIECLEHAATAIDSAATTGQPD